MSVYVRERSGVILPSRGAAAKGFQLSNRPKSFLLSVLFQHYSNTGEINLEWWALYHSKYSFMLHKTLHLYISREKQENMCV
jgi:hypothetical protein